MANVLGWLLSRPVQIVVKWGVLPVGAEVLVVLLSDKLF
jgi:hypothetical protein